MNYVQVFENLITQSKIENKNNPDKAIIKTFEDGVEALRPWIDGGKTMREDPQCRTDFGIALSNANKSKHLNRASRAVRRERK